MQSVLRQLIPLALLGLLLTVGCSDDPAGPPTVRPVEDLVLKWEYPFPVVSLQQMWGSAADDIHAVGSYGEILHYDGASWSDVPSPTRVSLTDVWGVASDNVVAVGSGGTILRFDGTQWQPEESGTDLSLFGVWGCARDSIYAVGWTGTIRRFDGDTWIPMAVPTTSDLLAVWGTAGDDLYVGARDALLHFDGQTWTDVGIEVRVRVIGIWGASSDDVWVTDGTNWLWHYDGAEWSNVRTNVNYPFMNFWGFASDNVFASGWDGLVSRFDGDAWSEHSVGNVILTGIWGASDTDVWASGRMRTSSAGALYHFDGSDWAQAGTALDISTLNDIWVSGNGEQGVAVSYDGSLIEKEGGAWTIASTAASSHLHAVWGAPSGQVFAAGDRGVFMHYDGSVWNESNLGTGVYFRDVWGTTDENVYMGSTTGLWHYDGTGWEQSAIHDNVNSVWGTHALNVFAAGTDSLYETGIVRRFDGREWTTVYSRPGTRIGSITGTGPEVYLVGTYVESNERFILRYRASTWTDITPPNAPAIHAIAAHRNFGLFAYGYNLEGGAIADHTLLRFDNNEWSAMDIRYGTSFNGMWGGSDDGIYLAGSNAIAKCVRQ